MPESKAQVRAERILTFEEARASVCAQAEVLLRKRRELEQVPLLASLGRTVAEEIVADRDFPPFPRATRDGFAIRAEDVQVVPAEIRVVGQIRAGGEIPQNFSQLKKSQGISIMTGAPVPSGADSVVMIEYTQRQGDVIRVFRSVAAGENVVPRGSESLAGAVLIQRGTRISHTHIALAAAVGKPSVNVYRRPKIGILSTGDEVVPINALPAENQIRNSNSFSLAAQIIAAGGEPIQLPIAPDEPERLRELVAEGFESDLLLLSGGVSAGEYDLVEDALSNFSAEFLFTGVQIQPGKPLVFGRARPQLSTEHWIYFFGLPGNPISTMVTFKLFASILVRALSGSSGEPTVQGTKARLGKEVRVKTGLTRFLPARLSGQWDDAEVEAVKWQGSGDLAAFARANCLLVIPPDREDFNPGEWMTVLPLHS